MMAGPHRDTARVEQVAHVMWVNLLPIRRGQCERDCAATIHRLVRTKYLEAAETTQTFQRVRRDVAFMRSDLIHSDRGQVLRRGGQSDRLSDRRGAGLKAMRRRG